jgi:hypothetical protein
MRTKPIRFRIRTIMIVIAAVAVLMGLLTAMRRWSALRGIPVRAIVVIAAIVFFLIALFVEFSVFAAYFSRGRTRPRQTRIRPGRHPRK